MNRNIKTAHGMVIDNDDELSFIFQKKSIDKKISHANNDNLNELSLAELQDIAENLGLLVTDNKTLLIQAIRREYQTS